jgi:hypothetical protein
MCLSKPRASGQITDGIHELATASCRTGKRGLPLGAVFVKNADNEGVQASARKGKL